MVSSTDKFGALREKLDRLEDLFSEIDTLNGSYQLKGSEQAKIPSKVEELQGRALVLRLQMIRILANLQ